MIINQKKSINVGSQKNYITIGSWLKVNLFSTWFNTLATVVFAAIIYFIAKGTVQWVLTVANWKVVSGNFRLFMVGQYSIEHLWRVWLILSIVTLLLGISSAIWRGSVARFSLGIGILLLIVSALPFMSSVSRIWLFGNVTLMLFGFAVGKKFPSVKRPTTFVWQVLLFPITLFLLHGFGVLPTVSTNLWGGFLLTVLIATVSIVVSFPLGVLLALARTSKLPIVKWFSIAYIELIRGVPLITILFMAQVMLPLFLSEGVKLDNVIRVMIAFILFNAAYLAENVRGGLQGLPRGQYEAAQALGLNSTFMMAFVVLPQALRSVIPAIVGQFISTFKDTSLVAIVGLIDLLGISKFIVANPDYLGTQMEVFLFIALIYWIFSYSMSYASQRLEESLGVGQR